MVASYPLKLALLVNSGGLLAGCTTNVVSSDRHLHHLHHHPGGSIVWKFKLKSWGILKLFALLSRNWIKFASLAFLHPHSHTVSLLPLVALKIHFPLVNNNPLTLSLYIHIIGAVKGKCIVKLTDWLFPCTPQHNDNSFWDDLLNVLYLCSGIDNYAITGEYSLLVHLHLSPCHLNYHRWTELCTQWVSI